MPTLVPTPAADGVLTTFTLPSAPSGDLFVFVDGAKQRAAFFTITGTALAFLPAAFPTRNGAPPPGAYIEVYSAGIVPLSGASTVWETAANLINDAARELGLITTPIADPFASADQNIVQLCALLKSGGRALLRARDWTHLIKEYTFTTVQGQSSYPLPADFRDMIDQTGWNRTSRLPLGGPTSPQEWQFLKGWLSGMTLSVLFRPLQGQLKLYPDTNTPGGYTIAFEYNSRYWVQPAGQTGGTTDVPTAGSDTILFEPLLVVRMLKHLFLRGKKLEHQSEQEDFLEALEQVGDDDSAAPVLRLGGGSRSADRLIDGANIPLGNWGQ